MHLEVKTFGGGFFLISGLHITHAQTKAGPLSPNPTFLGLNMATKLRLDIPLYF
jgi:hypothetical protein